MSCLSVAERSLRMIEHWKDEADFRIARRMWTTVTHVITCCITIILALEYRPDHALTCDKDRLRHCLAVGIDFVRGCEASSSIARRGCRLLSALVDPDARRGASGDVDLDVGNVIRRVAMSEASPGAAEAEAEPTLLDIWGQFIGESDLGLFSAKMD